MKWLVTRDFWFPSERASSSAGGGGVVGWRLSVRGVNVSQNKVGAGELGEGHSMATGWWEQAPYTGEPGVQCVRTELT